MALDRLTKITGPGIKTDTNWVGNNANFTGVTTTGSSFNVGVSTFHSTLAEVHNIKSTGIITATGGSFSGNVTAVDGTFTGNVSIAGTLTYEDVTNIDSVGIITAPAVDVDDFLDVGSNIKLGNAGVITATSFVGSGAALTGIDATAIKDSGGNVKIQAQASGAIHSGVSTFQDIDVDGHTNLDNVNIAGVTTFASNINLGDNDKIILGDGSDLQLFHDGTRSHLSNSTGQLRLGQGGTNVELYYGNVKCMHTHADNSGSVGLYRNLTATDDIQIIFGASADYRFFHEGSSSKNVLTCSTAGLEVRKNNTTEVSAKFIADGAAELYFDNTKRFETTNQGINVTGHSELDNVNIAGVTTTTGNVNVGGYVVSQGTSGRGGIFGQVEVGYDGTYLTIQPTSGHNDLHLNFDNGSTVQIGHSNGSTLTVNGNIKPKTDSASDLGLTGTRFRAAYVDTYYGDGSNLTGITQTTINSNTNNYLITGTGTANTLQGEANLTFDGSTLGITGAATLGNGSGLNWGDTSARIRGESGSSGLLRFDTNGGERLRIDSSGHLHTGYTSSFGNDHINILASDGGGIAIASNNVGNATTGDILGSLSFQGYLSGAGYGSAEARISAIVSANHTGSSAATDMVFYTKPSSTGPGSAPTERARIASDGKMGLGVTDPKSLLHLGSTGDIRFGSQYGGFAHINQQVQYAAGYTGTHWMFESNNMISWCFDGVLIVYGGGGSSYGSEVTKITIVYSRENGANNSGDMWRNGTTSYNIETLGHAQVGLNPGAGSLTTSEDTAPDGAASQRSLFKLGWTTAGHGGATTTWSKLHGTMYWGQGVGYGSVEVQDKDGNIFWNSNP